MFWLTAEMFQKQTTILFLVSYNGHLKMLMFAAVGWTKHFYNITSVFMKLFWTFLIIDQLIGQHFNWCLQIYKHQDVHCQWYTLVLVWASTDYLIQFVVLMCLLSQRAVTAEDAAESQNESWHLMSHLMVPDFIFHFVSFCCCSCFDNIVLSFSSK